MSEVRNVYLFGFTIPLWNYPGATTGVRKPYHYVFTVLIFSHVSMDRTSCPVVEYGPYRSHNIS